MNRVLPLMAVATFLLTGCPTDGLRPDRALGFVRITPDGTPVHHSGLTDPARLAVFDEAAFAETWARAFASREPAALPPAVDFASEFVVFVALGEKPSGGYAIEVSGALEEDGAVVVGVIATSPGKNCPVTLAMTQPLDVVRVKRPGTGKPAVSFAEKSVTTDCGP